MTAIERKYKKMSFEEKCCEAYRLGIEHNSLTTGAMLVSCGNAEECMKILQRIRK